jgi:hypothetical protein
MGLGTTITSEPFLVLRRLDIFSDPSLLTPVPMELSKRSSGTCFCAFGGLTANFTINKTGHLPGDDIIIDAEIRNDCKQSVKTIQVAIRVTSYF